MSHADAELRFRTQAIETALRAHPAVRDVRAVASVGPGALQITCYVVPHEAELPEPAEASQVQKWRKVFDLIHTGPNASEVEHVLPRPKWTSSYTRQEFAPEEIDEWIDATVRRVQQLAPSRILELGCGIGVLAARLAQRCAGYLGTDLSGRSLEQFAAYLRAVRPSLDHVSLLEQAANDFSGIPERAFDAVLVNSVIQYFPSENYLSEVLGRAVRAVRPGGVVYVGDVRSLPLLGLFSTSLELFRAPTALGIPEVRERIARRIAKQDELLLSPAYFLDWGRAHPGVADVCIEPKRGRFTNEFSAYRYEVVIHVGERRELLAPRWIDWTSELDLAVIAGMLSAPGSESLALRGIANARLGRDLAAWFAIERAAAPDVEGVNAQAIKAGEIGLSPEDLHVMAAEHGFRARLSFASSTTDGRFDAVFERTATPVMPIAWPELAPGSGPTFNEPSGNTRRHSLVPGLMAHAQKLLESAWVPTRIAVVEALPDEAGAD